MRNNIHEQEYDIGFIFAMKEELQSVLIQDPRFTSANDFDEAFESALIIGGTKFIPFKLKTTEKGSSSEVYVNCLACLTGIGRTNAASGTALLCSKFKVHTLINMGLCGSVERIPKGTIIIGQHAVYGDVNLKAFDYHFGEIPKAPYVFFPSANKFIEQVLYPQAKQFYDIRLGCVMTVDSFINNQSYKENIIKVLGESAQDLNLYIKFECFDMEAAAIMHVAANFGHKVLVFKEVSDSADSEATEDFSDSAYSEETTALQNLTCFLTDSLPTIYHSIQVSRSRKLQTQER